MDNTISNWIDGVKVGDTRSQQEIWDAYFKQLVALARNRLQTSRMREMDEEDIAIAAFNSFYRAVDEKRLPKLDDRTDLWRVLVVIASRKIADSVRRATAMKRGGGLVRGESVFMGNDDSPSAGINQVLGKVPTPELAAETAETYDCLIKKLEDPQLERIANWKLEGYTNSEIAEMMGCVQRTVERKLERIRAVWISDFGEEE